jgi:mono/diheme cytochrome c family protein
MHEAKDLNTPVSITALDKPAPLSQQLSRLGHVWTPVQCENCHTNSQDHPFSPGMTKQVATTRCVQCHTPERAPDWYTPAKDGVPAKLIDALVDQKLKQVSCPANKENAPAPQKQE